MGRPPTHAEIEPALPATQSHAVVVGEVTDAQAYLSEDKTSIYSEFTVRIDEIIKNNTAVTLAPGSFITTVRTGGAVRFPSGKIIQRGFGGKPFPLTKRTYVFFLKYEREGQDYPIITAYELRAGLVYPLDGLDIDGTLLEPYARYQEYKGLNEAIFLNKVREAVVLSAAIWHGRDKPKVPFRYGLTRSLMLAIYSSKGDFSTYERDPSGKPFERSLVGDVLRAEVRLIGEYLDDPKADICFYVKLVAEDVPKTVNSTGEEFYADLV